MAMNTLEQIQELVNQLSLVDQVRLLDYLTPRIVQTIESTQQYEPAKMTDLSAAWSEFFRIGDAIAAIKSPQSETLTAAVTTMRR